MRQNLLDSLDQVSCALLLKQSARREQIRLALPKASAEARGKEAGSNPARPTRAMPLRSKASASSAPLLYALPWRSQASRTESRYAEAEEARRTHLPTLTFYPLTLFTHCITHFVHLPTTAKIVGRKVKRRKVKRRRVKERGH